MNRWDMRRTRLEMVPLMDCMFLLLTFFIYYAASAMASTYLPIELPSATSGASEAPRELLRIVVRVEGTILLDDQPVELAGLEDRLRAWRVAYPEGEVHIAADQAVAYGIPLAVLDIVRGVGITRVGLETAQRRKSRDRALFD